MTSYKTTESDGNAENLFDEAIQTLFLWWWVLDRKAERL